MSDNNYDQAVGEAWALHRNNQFEEAIATFQTILNSDPNHIDANYGIALALRSNGKNAEAIQHLQTAQSSLRLALQNVRTRAEAEGQHIANNLSTTLDVVAYDQPTLRRIGRDCGIKRRRNFLVRLSHIRQGEGG
jgi:tetratricopeptide (TPR) repeat protein